MQTDRLPPTNVEAERSVLAAVMWKNEIIGDVACELKPEDFYTFAHQEIFREIVKLFLNGKPSDPVTVAHAMKENGKVDDIGYDFFINLASETPSAANVPSYVEIVRDMSLRRNQIAVAKELADGAYDLSTPASETSEKIEGKLFAISQGREKKQAHSLPTVMSEAMVRFEAQVEAVRNKQSCHNGVLTGWVDLDDLTAGLQNSELTIVAARPSVGKTSWALHLFRNIAVEQNLPAVFFSLEQGRYELAERLLCLEGRINSHFIRHRNVPRKSDIERAIAETECKLRQHEFAYIQDDPNQTIISIVSESRRLKIQKGIRMVMIDYLQLITPEDKKAQRQEQVASLSRRLKLLARELQIPVVVLAQLNRNSDGQRPKLADLRESGAIEQDADTVLMLHNPAQNDPKVAPVAGQVPEAVRMELIVGKQRNGPTGDVELGFTREFMRFDNWTDRPGRY